MDILALPDGRLSREEEPSGHRRLPSLLLRQLSERYGSGGYPSPADDRSTPERNDRTGTSVELYGARCFEAFVGKGSGVSPRGTPSSPIPADVGQNPQGKSPYSSHGAGGGHPTRLSLLRCFGEGFFPAQRSRDSPGNGDSQRRQEPCSHRSRLPALPGDTGSGRPSLGFRELLEEQEELREHLCGSLGRRDEAPFFLRQDPWI
ncbi:MAG: hypothetical protein BWY86_00347 [Candidatus Aminicenantes bacterium ADurb.Bin508]|nr:MAG: hypothetical protein BWY86_00347 [Candidatus Aminicenantes bacterium ADurb.Bin508]